MKLKIFFLCLSIVLMGDKSSCNSLSGDLKLQLVQVLFRHGERTPQKDEAKLIVNASESLYEPWGFAQLTNTGKNQEFRLGEMLRERYGDFLGEDYRPENIYARSSDYDRTKASLELVLAGLYPPTEIQTWNEDLPWQPIPIHSAPKQLDNLFGMDKCQKFQSTYKKLMKTPELQEKVMEFSDVLGYLQRVYPDVPMDLEQLFYMNTLLNIMKTQNVELPDWYTPELHARVTAGAKLYLDTLSYTPSLIRLNGGPLVRRMIENMGLDGKANPRKIYLYSGHEFTVYAVAKAHLITLDKSPAYGSAIIIEKLRDDNDELYVKMSYWTGPSEDFIPIKLNGYEYCPMKDYISIVSRSLPTDDEMRCLFKYLRPTDLEKITNTDSFTISS